MKSFDSEKGFTMLEMILALVLIALLMSGLMAVYWVAGNAFYQETSISEMQYTVREVRQMILKDIHSSESAEVMSWDGSKLNSGEAGRRLRLIIPVMKEEGVEYIAICYYIENSKLYRERFMLYDKQNSGDDQLLDKIPVADHMISLSFSNSRVGVIEYELISGDDRNTFRISGRVGSKMDYSIDGI